MMSGMSNYGRVIHDAQVQMMIGKITDKAHYDTRQWRGKGHYAQVLDMIERGVPDEEISAKHPGWRGDVLEICHKIVAGRLTKISDLSSMTDKQYKEMRKKQKKREEARKAAYRRKYGKGRNLRQV